MAIYGSEQTAPLQRKATVRLVVLAERGVRAEADAKEQLKASYLRFIDEKEPALKNQASVDLIRSIFGTDAIAEVSPGTGCCTTP